MLASRRLGSRIHDPRRLILAFGSSHDRLELILSFSRQREAVYRLSWKSTPIAEPTTRGIATPFRTRLSLDITFQETSRPFALTYTEEERARERESYEAEGNKGGSRKGAEGREGDRTTNPGWMKFPRKIACAYSDRSILLFLRYLYTDLSAYSFFRIDRRLSSLFLATVSLKLSYDRHDYEWQRWKRDYTC